MEKKDFLKMYETPAMEIVEVETQGVICTSTTGPNEEMPGAGDLDW